MATHFSILAWRMPWAAGPGRQWSIGSHRVRHDLSDLAHIHTHTHTHTLNNVGDFQDRGAWRATAHRVAKSQTQLK